MLTGRSNGVIVSLVQVPVRSGSPHAVFITAAGVGFVCADVSTPAAAIASAQRPAVLSRRVMDVLRGTSYADIWSIGHPVDRVNPSSASQMSTENLIDIVPAGGQFGRIGDF